MILLRYPDIEKTNVIISPGKFIETVVLFKV